MNGSNKDDTSNEKNKEYWFLECIFKTKRSYIRVKELKRGYNSINRNKKKGHASQNLAYYDHIFSGVAQDKRAQQGESLPTRKGLRKYIASWEAMKS